MTNQVKHYSIATDIDGAKYLVNHTTKQYARIRWATEHEADRLFVIANNGDWNDFSNPADDFFGAPNSDKNFELTDEYICEYLNAKLIPTFVTKIISELLAQKLLLAA